MRNAKENKSMSFATFKEEQKLVPGSGEELELSMELYYGLMHWII